MKKFKKLSLNFFVLLAIVGSIYGCKSKTEDESLVEPTPAPAPAPTPTPVVILNPSISFSPTSGSVGTIVTITATDFDSLNPSAVTVGGVNAIILKSTSTSVVVLSLSSTDGKVVLTPASGSPITSTSDFSFVASSPPSQQQGAKLVGSGGSSNAGQGFSVDISADGDTVLVGGFQDDGLKGAAWVFTRTAGVWTQQGLKLVGSDVTGNAGAGRSVALSADGNTALVGGPQDNSGRGAVWVFTRTAGVWTQQGSKLVATGNTGAYSLALSADGNTALVGAPYDSSSRGAAWVFTRTSGVWTQQGSKLVGAGGVLTNSNMGYSVALSADGNTAILGANGNNSNQGAAWVFTRTSGTWTQQGLKLVGTGNTGAAQQGYSVALSADGNTALLGGFADNSNQGAAWVFTRTAGVWSQQGAKLVGTGNTGAAQQGFSVALSADGNTALIGGNYDNPARGAVWIFTRTSGVWTQQGAKLVGTGNSGSATMGHSVALSANGETAVAGGYFDDAVTGAAWIFVP